MVKSVVVDEVAIVEKLLEPISAARMALEQCASRLTEKRHDKMAIQVSELRSATSMIRQSQHQHHHETATGLATIDYTTGRIYHQNSRIETKVDDVVGVISGQIAHVNRIYEENAALREKIAKLEILNSFHMLTEERRRNQTFHNESRYMVVNPSNTPIRFSAC